MLATVVCSMVALHQGQAYPTYANQGYSSVPAVPSGLQPYGALALAGQGNYIVDTQEVSKAKQEFMVAFRRAMDGLLGELAPTAVQDTREVRQAKEEFFTIFNSALNGIIETRFMRDTDEVRQRKDEFFGTFDKAVSNLLTTVEENYLEDTEEVKAAKVRFGAAYADAEAGKVGSQYLSYTPEVEKARKRFFRFFDFVLNGGLARLSPIPGNNVIPEEIADFYIKDDSEVTAAKKEFDQLYRDALGGDLASAIAYTVLEENDNNSEDAVEELENTLKELEGAIEEDKGRSDVEDESTSVLGEEEYDEDDSTSELDEEEYDEDDEDYDEFDEEFKSTGDPFAGIAGILDAIELGEDDDVELIA